MLDRFRRIINPVLRELLGIEICKILTDDDILIGIGVRLWMKSTVVKS